MHSLFWENNLLFMNNGKVNGVYVLPDMPYENQPENIKRSIFRQLDVFFQTYHGKGQILSLARPIPPQEIADKMKSYSKHEHWKSHMDIVQEVVVQTGVYERLRILILPLSSSYHVAWDAVLDRPDLLRDRLSDQGKRFFGYIKRKRDQNKGIPIITEADMNNAMQADVRMLNRLSALIPQVRRAEPFEVEFIHRSPYFRGLIDIPMNLPAKLPTTVSTTTEGVILRPRPIKLALTSSAVREDTFRLRVEHDDGRVAYQSVLAVATMPEKIDVIGDEWLYQPLEKLNFPIDACVHFEIIPPKRARDVVDRRKKVATGQAEEFGKVGDIPWDVYDGLEDAQGLEAKLKSGMALAQYHAFYAVGADSEMEMLSRETKLKQRLNGIMQLVHPPGDALKLWQAFFPGEMEGVQKTWEIPSDPQMLAASGLIGTIHVGDPTGQWFARLMHNRKPVFVDWFRAMTIGNRTGAAAFIGTLGSGKSVGMKYAADTMLQWGAMGVIVDPKQAEYGSIVGLWRKETVWWRFTAESKLTFTPFRLGRDELESKQFAEGFLSVLLNITSQRTDQWASLVIRRALDRLYRGQLWDMDRFLTCLQYEAEDTKRSETERELARLFYEMLLHYKTDVRGKAIFGVDGESNTMDDNARLVVISIMGLDFPSANQTPDSWRESQRFAVSILYLITQIGFHKLMAAPAHIKKFFLIDEAWILRSIPEGRALINHMILLGRSMNLVLMLGIQNPDVLLPKEGEQNDDISANLGWVFCGRLTSKTQIGYAVNLLGLPEEEDHTEKFQAFEKGKGFLRDPYGRVGEIQVDVIDRSLLEAFSTTPQID